MFYTNVEHHVETVTEGVFIVLQYDIEVATGTDKETAEESFDNYDWPLGFVSTTYSNCIKYLGVIQAMADKIAIERVINHIKRLHTLGIGEVGFVMDIQYIFPFSPT